jgi:hypothetical protein
MRMKKGQKAIYSSLDLMSARNFGGVGQLRECNSNSLFGSVFVNAGSLFFAPTFLKRHLLFEYMRQNSRAVANHVLLGLLLR